MQYFLQTSEIQHHCSFNLFSKQMKQWGVNINPSILEFKKCVSWKSSKFALDKSRYKELKTRNPRVENVYIPTGYFQTLHLPTDFNNL